MNHDAMNRRAFLRSTAVGSVAIGCIVPESHPATATRPAGRQEGLVAFRIGTEQWMTERRFEGLLAFFARHPKAADELAFFTSGTHPPLPLAEIRRRADRLAERMPRVRAAGMAAGINLLATMGHHEENLEGSLNEPWQRVTDPQARESRGSYCPAGEEFLEYVASVYGILARTSPDFLWIDDDVRLAGHMPVGFTCFCEGCLRRFSKAMDQRFTRESLLERFRNGSLAERLAWRRRWLDHNRATLDRLFALIERTVHHAKPRMPLGFMTGDRFYEGYAFTRWATTLAGPEQVPVRWRPGGGFYSDESLSGMVGKAHDIGRQVSRLPGTVQVIQSEIENFPYDLLRKSVETTVLEASVHMGAGATGAAFNVLSQRPDPLDEYEPMLRRIAEVRPWYLQLRKAFGRHPVIGVWPAWDADTFVANHVDGAWPDGTADALGALSRSHVLGEIGIPLCYGPEGARVTVLAGSGLLAFPPDRVRAILSGGVLMDLAAWEALDRLGLADSTGVKPGKVRSRDAIEVLSDHPLNGRFAGWSRDCRQSFWHEPAQSLVLAGTGAVPLARMIDYQGRDLGVAMSAFENVLGGRVVVMGYFPWSQMHHLAKSSQMKAICAWLSRDRLPLVVDTFARVHLWIRERGPGDMACLVLNASLDPVKNLRLRVAGTARAAHWSDMEGRRRSVRPARGPDGTDHRILRVPEVKPWGTGLMTVEG